MFITQVRVAVAILLAASFGSGTGFAKHPALPQKPATQPGPEKLRTQGQDDAAELTAVVQSVDVGKNTITVVGKLSGVRTFDLARDARVILDDGTGGKLGFRDGKLSDVAEGLTITVRLSENRKSVIGIWVEGPIVRADVKTVSVTKRTITVMIPERKNEPAQEKTFDVASNVTVVIHDGKSKDKVTPESPKLADVPAGTIVTLKLSADQKLVGSIQVEGPEVQGFVKAVDGGKNTITLSINDGKQTVEKTFEVLPTASLAIGDSKEKGKPELQSRKLMDLPVGSLVTLKLTPSQKQVVSVSTQAASVSGMVKAVDLGKSSLTLLTGGSKTEPPEEKSFEIARDVSVRIDGKEAKLTDLSTETLVTVKLFTNRNVIGSIYAEGPNVSGTVKAVDVGQGTVTLAAGKSGEERTLSLSKNFPIIVDGKPGKLADVVVDAVVDGKLTVDQKTVVNLNVSGPSLQGVLKSVDVARGKITATVPVSKNEFEDREFNLTKDVAVVLNRGKTSTSLKPADLKAGNDVALQLSSDKKTVLGIRVIEP